MSVSSFRDDDWLIRMEYPFRSARLKIERAKEHFNDLRAKGQFFADTHPHQISIQTDPHTGNDVLSIAPAEPFPDQFLLVLGDMLHNLRSALDHAWVQTVFIPGKHSKFPIHKSIESLVAAVNGLKENATEEVKRFIVNVVQPYETGNGKLLVGLHDLDIEDKHWLLITHRQFTRIRGLRAIDERGEEFDIGDWLIVPPHTASKSIEGHRNFAITNNGDARSHVVFGEGSCLQGYYVLPTLHSMTNIIVKIIDRLETLRIESGR
jgi:hypothetical protein